MLVLKPYQIEKVRELKFDFLKLLSQEKPSSIVFEAPTGSGKTIMMQEFLRQVAEIPKNRNLAFIWLSIGDLSRQSRESFERNLESSHLIFSELSDIKTGALRENEILFVNWEKLKQKDSKTGEWKVLAMKDNERDENIPKYMENTRSKGLEIVLIIDESSRELDTAKAQELISEYFKPIVQIEVSATPDSAKYDKKITVDMSDVIGSGMIKKEILVNEDIDVVRVGEFGDYGTDRLIIAKARQKQDELSSAYEAVSDTPVRPLLLIQLPSESATTTEMDRTKMDRVKQILKDDFDVTIENQRLAIWLSEDKTNKDLIEIANSPVEVLLFKQAIAYGWDCPRSQILVMFRKIGSFTFEIQTIGRILRMPEQKHYENELLNKAYVYTDLEKNSIMVHDTAKNMIKNQVAIVKMDLYKPFSLPSTFASRGDYNDLGSSFYEVFFEHFLVHIMGGEYHKTLEFLGIERNRRIFESMLDTKDLDMTGSLIKDGKIFVDIDRHTGEHIIISDKHIETRQEEELIELQFDNFCRSSVWPQFGNIARSYKTIKECLFGLFERYIFGDELSRMDIQKLVLKNKDQFSTWMNEIKDYYRPIRIQQVDEKTQAKFKNKTWSVPHTIGFAGEKVEVTKSPKYIYTPGYIAFDSAIERDFATEYLDVSEEVAFWYKNGVQLDIYFGIKYEQNGVSRMFYPDFVVYFRSGAIGIFETKDGITLTSAETREKAEALEKYSLEMNAKGYRIISGIVKKEGIMGDSIFMIGKRWRFDLVEASSFEILNDDFIRSYQFNNDPAYSPEYITEIRAKIQALSEEKLRKEAEYAEFIEEQKRYDSIDNATMVEKMLEIEKIGKQIWELKGEIVGGV